MQVFIESAQRRKPFRAARARDFARQQEHADAAIHRLHLAGERQVKARHRPEAIGPGTARGRHDQTEHRAHRLLRRGVRVDGALRLRDRHTDLVE